MVTAAMRMCPSVRLRRKRTEPSGNAIPERGGAVNWLV
jgi:hypothetical protein